MNEVRNVLLGFEINKEGSQICYYDRKAQEPVSVPTKVGTNLFVFPTELAKTEGKSEWHFGLEAEYFGHLKGGILLDDLYDIVQGTEPKMVDRTLMEPWEILGVFLRESLKLLGLRDLTKSISAVMLTTKKLSGTFAGNIKKAFESLGFLKGQYFLQDAMESFYYYTYSQKPEFWLRRTALFSFENTGNVVFSEISEDRGSRPSVVTIRNSEPVKLSDVPDVRDLEFLEYASGHMKADVYSCVLLTGGGFDREWSKRSVQFLCRCNRKVFYGDNLFVKGACYAAFERKENHAFRGRLYMGEDLVRTNVGMEMLVQGNPAYYPLVAAGTNWFEVADSCEFILDDKESLVFSVNSMDGQSKKFFSMQLPGLPVRPNRTTRIRLNVFCTSRSSCTVEAEDLGFGGLFPSSHKVWRETLAL